MTELKVVAVNENVITLQHTYTLKINNTHDLIEAWFDDAITASELSVIREAMFPELTDDEFNKIASEIDQN